MCYFSWPYKIIFEGKHILLGADPEIPIPGFLIVNTKRHVNSFSELNKEERNEIGNVIVYAEKALKELNIVKEKKNALNIFIYGFFLYIVG